MNKDFKIIKLENFIYIKFYGDIDDSVCPRYKESIGKLINDNKDKDLVFDFKNVTFIDSSGIGLILGRYNQLKSHRRKLYVTETNSQIKKLFQISGIYTIINEINKEKVGISNE